MFHKWDSNVLIKIKLQWACNSPSEVFNIAEWKMISSCGGDDLV